MKSKLIYFFVSLLTFSLLISSCSQFTDVNTDPTRLKNASVSQVLTAAEASTAFYVGSDVFLYSSIFMQQGAGQGVSGTQTRFYDQYILTNTDVNNTFSNFYADPLADLDYLRKNAGQSNPQHSGVAKIMQSYIFSTIVDCWGSVPYKEALKGVDNVQPRYDDSKEIYDSLFVLVDSGIANLGQANVLKIGAEDLIYGGDITKWTKFANTLKLRLALHYANIDNGAKLKALLSSGATFMTSNADNFQLTFENVVNRYNPFNQFEISRADYYASGKFIVDLMNTKNDPRRATYFSPFPYNSSPATYKGTLPGDASTAPYSRLFTYFRGAIVSDNGARNSAGGLNSTSLVYTGIAPQRMLTFAEYNFIRAEAALSYGTGEDPNLYYKAGVSASMSDAGVSAAAITTYTAALAPVTLQSLIEEKYVATFGVPVESWSDWRRTGFPSIAVSPAAAAQGNNTIPRILVYPLSETQTNSANLPTRASMTVKGVFWDK